VIATGVGDDSAVPVFFGERSYLVVSAAQLERADGLKIFRLEVKLAAFLDSARFMEMRRDQFCPYGNTT
jgi:hypothetical protein